MQQVSFLLWLKMLFHASHPLTGTAGMYDLYWLQGVWVQPAAHDTLTEQWNVQSDSLIAGLGMMTRGKEVVFSEELSLRLDETGIAYVPVVSNQNAGKAVSFRLTRARRNTWTFENPAHDFPQRIVYHRKGKKAMRVWIEGKQKGKYHKEVFHFMRVREQEY